MDWVWYALCGVIGIAAAIGLAVCALYRERIRTMHIQWHMVRQRYDRALPLVERQLADLQSRHGDRHIETAVAKYTLGQIHFEHGRKDHGRRLVEEAAAFFRDLDAPRGNDYAVYLMNLGCAQRAIGEKEAALRSMRKCAELALELYGPDDWQTAEARNNVAVLLDEIGQPAEALAEYEEVLRVRKAAFGEDSFDVGKVLVNMAESQISLGSFPAARTALERALELLGKNPGHELGQAYDSYGRLCEAQENWERAEEMRIQSLTVFERELGTGHVEVATQMEKLAAVLEKLERPTEGELARRRALRIREALV